MNHLIIKYLLCICLAMINPIYAMVPVNVTNFDNLAILAKAYIDNNAAIEATELSIDTKHQDYPDGAKRLVNSDKIDTNQKAMIAELVAMDDDAFVNLVGNYLTKNQTLKDELQSPTISPTQEKFILQAVRITTLLNYINPDLDVDTASFKLKGNSRIQEYERQLETIENKLVENRKKKPAVTTPKSTPTTSDSTTPTPKTSKVDLTSLKWLNDLETFFSEEITRRSETSKKYAALAQSIQGLVTNPANGPTVIDGIVNQITQAINANKQDPDYIKTVVEEFQKISDKIKSDDVKTIFGTNYEKLPAIAPYLQEQTLRNLYNNVTGTSQQKKTLRTFINTAFVQMVSEKIISNLKAAQSADQGIEVLNKYKSFIPLLKRDQNISNSIAKIISTKNNWTSVSNAWSKTQSVIIGAQETLLTLPTDL